MSGLGKYLKDIGKHSLLTKQQEQELAKRIEAGDQAAKREMIQRNLRLAVSVAKKMQKKTVDLEDLIQEANIGLIRAVEKFDWRKGFRFSTYAHWWIRQSVSRFLQMNGKTVRVPGHAQGLYYKIQEAKKVYREEFECDPNNAEIAEILGVTVKSIEASIDAPSFAVSLDAPRFQDSESGTLASFIPDEESENPDDVVARKHFTRSVTRAMRKLSNREQAVIRLRFGISEPDEKEVLTMTQEQENYLFEREEDVTAP
jgi:RNA polymerase primary sigma factor|tara:strand:- start:7030 stop:7800 length:771 start_codon:yes stop_codon:yes gene_type:complete